MYGKVEYNEEGKPICEICGLAFDRLMAHVRQIHDMSAKEYKVAHGLDVGKGICSDKSRQLSRDKVFKNYDKVVAQNLLKNGQKTRFKAGDKGRTKDKVSEQTRLGLAERIKNLFKKK